MEWVFKQKQKTDKTNFDRFRLSTDAHLMELRRWDGCLLQNPTNDGLLSEVLLIN